MADIGRSDLTGAAQTPFVPPEFQNIILQQYVYTAEANEQLTAFNFQSGDVSSPGTITFALFDVTDTPNPADDPDGATLVAEAAISSIIQNAQNTVTLGSPVALTAGRQYAVGFRISVGTVWMMRHNPGVQSVVFESDVAGDQPWGATFSYPAVNSIATWEYVVWATTEATAGSPTITNVTDPIRTNQPITFDGTNFEAVQGSGSVTQNGTALTITQWNDTQIIATGLDITSTNEIFENHDFIITNDSTNNVSTTEAILPDLNWNYINLSGTMEVGGLYWEGSPAVAAGQQLVYDTRIYENDETTVVAGKSIETFADSSIVVTGSMPDGTYKIRANRYLPGTGWTGVEWVTLTFSSAPDTTIPVITLVGANPLNIEYQGTYTDPGATASDNLDGDITGDIVVGGDTVDVNTLGAYTVTYDVQDAAGNNAVQVTRTVNIVDTTAPVITLTGSTPVNVVQGTSYVDAGATATDAHDGNLTGSIVVGGDTVDINTVGSYTITYDVQDAAGNNATQVTRTVNVVATDTIPDAFDFTNLSSQPLSTIVESNVINVSGINSSTPISISTSDGVEFRVNSDPYRSTATTVNNGDTVQLRVTTSDTNLTTLTATLDIGGVTDQWDVTTITAITSVELQVGNQAVENIKYCISDGILVDVELEIDGISVWPIS